MNDKVMMKRRASKTEQQNRVKTVSGDFLINRQNRRKKIAKGKNMEEEGEERRTSPPSLHLNKMKQNIKKNAKKLVMTTV